MIIFVGVSPVELSRFYRWLTPSGTRSALSRLYNVIVVNRVLFQARFLESRRSANEAREHTSVCDRVKRVLQRRVQEAGEERALGYMTK